MASVSAPNLKEIDRAIQELQTIRLKQAISPLLLSPENATFRYSVNLSTDTYFSYFGALPESQDFYFKSFADFACANNPNGQKPVFEDDVFTCQIDGFGLTLPASYHIAVADPEVSDIDVLPVRELVGRSFTPLVYNPVAGARSTFGRLYSVSIGPSALFCWPHIQKSSLVSVPLCHGENPPCVFVSPLSHKFYDDLDVSVFV